MFLLALLACKPPADAAPTPHAAPSQSADGGPKGPPPGQPGGPYDKDKGQPGGQQAGQQGGQQRSPQSGQRPDAPIADHPNAAAAPVSFVPPTGREANAKEGSPGMFRILGATSKDGVKFTPTNAVIADQGNVPDIVTGKDGALYLYYTASNYGKYSSVLAAAKSTDKGKTWVHYVVTVSGTRPPMVDPDVQLLSDGTFRLYFTGGQNTKPVIAYAEGTDGLSFVGKGEVFAPPEGAIDSNVFRVGKTWHLYAFDGKGNPVHHATSPDGTKFTRTNQPGEVGKDAIGSNVVSLASGGIRMFTFDLRRDIAAWTSPDGVTWKKDATVSFPRGNRSLEGTYVKDATATQLPDGTWFAAYVTPIP